MKPNNEIREVIKERGIKHWQLARILGISENTLVRWLRVPLTNERKKIIINALDSAAEEEE